MDHPTEAAQTANCLYCRALDQGEAPAADTPWLQCAPEDGLHPLLLPLHAGDLARLGVVAPLGDADGRLYRIALFVLSHASAEDLDMGAPAYMAAEAAEAAFVLEERLAQPGLRPVLRALARRWADRLIAPEAVET